jgi:hypothetical protein
MAFGPRFQKKFHFPFASSLILLQRLTHFVVETHPHPSKKKKTKNKVDGCLDMNITRLVAPFMELGLVDVIRIDGGSDSTTGSSIKEGQKQVYMQKLFAVGKPLCKWGSQIDSDEIWYPLDPNHALELAKAHRGEIEASELSLDGSDMSGIGQLVPLLERLHVRNPKLGAAIWGWGETDNEAKMLRSPLTLMETYPRTCYFNFNHKVWNLMDSIHRLMDHSFDPLDPETTKREVFENSQHMWMIHYQMRSVEEYLLKIDQAFLEWKRSLTTSHKKCNSKTRRSYGELQNARGTPKRIPYAKLYIKAVKAILDAWPIDASTTYLAPIGFRTIAYQGTQDWELYMFMKWAVASKYEWNERLYLTRNPTFSLDLYDDGLHHFLSHGFYHNATGCFYTPAGEGFCVHRPPTS